MNSSRRNFIKITGMAGSALMLKPFFFNEILKGATSKGFLFDSNEAPEIKHRLESPLFKEFWEELLTADLTEDIKFLETGIQFNNQLRHLPKICKIVQHEAFIYAITGDKKRGELARFALNQLFKFKK